MIDVYVCTNLVNYTVALGGPAGTGTRRALVLYEPWRFRRQPLARSWHWPIHIWSLRAVKWLARLGVVHTLYIPHDRFNKRVAAAARSARCVAYLDDGLDTLRGEPRNFGPPRGAAKPDYFTFSDYRRLPDWLGRFTLRQVAQLRQLTAAAGREPMELEGMDHVFFESPGLKPKAVIQSLGLDPARVLVVRHPVPAKRGELPPGCRMVEGSAFNAEATLLASQGKTFYFGETMVLVFALFTEASARNTVLAQLDERQRTNLSVLPLVPAGNPGLPQLLKPAD